MIFYCKEGADVHTKLNFALEGLAEEINLAKAKILANKVVRGNEMNRDLSREDVSRLRVTVKG